MATFPEEPLSLGYFPTDINQPLNGGTYTVVRKLGWGSRSSTWLVRQIEDDEVIYWAAQIFTVAASKGVAERLVPVFQNQLSHNGNSFPNYRAHFWEKSAHGEHLCLIVTPYGLPIVSVLSEAIQSGQAGLPVHVVQYATNQILEALQPLHSKKVMHGGVKAKNIAFTPATQAEWLQPVLDAKPPAATATVDGFPVVQSQPLDNYKPEWNEPMSYVADWMLDLVGYTHAQASPYNPEEGVDYGSAPETLVDNATCGPQTDIWMVGCLVYKLLAGNDLVASTSTTEERLAQIQAALRYGVLDQRLKVALSDEEATAAATFLKKCLVIDPEGRGSAKDLQLNDPWVEEGGKCSCCYS